MLGLHSTHTGASHSQRLYDFGGSVVVARPWVFGQSVSTVPWCRGGDTLPGVSGGTKVVRLVILGFLEAVTGGRSLCADKGTHSGVVVVRQWGAARGCGDMRPGR